MRKKFAWLTLALAVLFVVNLLWGPVRIPAADVMEILFGGEPRRATWGYIVLQSRLPQALTALLAGAALSAGGLMLQTAFRNPLADPFVFGVNSGAGLGVALVMFVSGGTIVAGAYTLYGFMAVMVGAFVGAMAVMATVFFFSTLVRDAVMLLVVGIMTGYIASSAVTLLNFFATEEGVKSYMIWGMGSFGGVTMSQMPLLASVVVLALAASLLLIKPLNALLLGEHYAKNLGVSVRRVRHALLVITGILAAAVTAFCGPVSFIGLAVPHITRLLFRTDNHATLLPATILTGAVTALLCNALCTLPLGSGSIPLSAVTPLIGAPVVIFILVKRTF